LTVHTPNHLPGSPLGTPVLHAAAIAASAMGVAP
jgi:hypothetical protein